MTGVDLPPQQQQEIRQEKVHTKGEEKNINQSLSQRPLQQTPKTYRESNLQEALSNDPHNFILTGNDQQTIIASYKQLRKEYLKRNMITDKDDKERHKDYFRYQVLIYTINHNSFNDYSLEMLEVLGEVLGKIIDATDSYPKVPTLANKLLLKAETLGGTEGCMKMLHITGIFTNVFLNLEYIKQGSAFSAIVLDSIITTIGQNTAFTNLSRETISTIISAIVFVDMYTKAPERLQEYVYKLMTGEKISINDFLTTIDTSLSKYETMTIKEFVEISDINEAINAIAYLKQHNKYDIIKLVQSGRITPAMNHALALIMDNDSQVDITKAIYHFNTNTLENLNINTSKFPSTINDAKTLLLSINTLLDKQDMNTMTLNQLLQLLSLYNINTLIPIDSEQIFPYFNYLSKHKQTKKDEK